MTMPRRLEGLQRSGIRAIMDLATSMEGVVRLELGEPDFPTPEHVVEAAHAAAASGMTRYTSSWGIPELRAAIADKARAVNHSTVDPTSEILVTAGAANALLVTLAVVADPGEAVLVPNPGWPNFTSMTQMLGLQAVPYRLRPENDFLPDADEIATLARRSDVRALVVNTPSNPTGSVLGQETMDRLSKVGTRHGLTVVTDETYDQILLDQAPPGFVLDPELNAVRVFSFSKTYAMTGWRIGYLTGPREIVAHAARVQEAWLSCCNAPAQKAAEAALRGPQHAVEEMLSEYRERRGLVQSIAESTGLALFRPAGAFYALIDVSSSGIDGGSFARRLLEEHRVAVAPGGTFGSETSYMIRVSLAADRDSIDRGVRRIADFLA